MAYHTTAKMAERKEARRTRLLREAIRTFGKKGYHMATVPMIVGAAGSSIGSFYFYFRNKEDIFAEVLQEVERRIAAALNAAIAAAGPEGLMQMRAAVKAFAEFLGRHPEEARILLVESSGLSARLEKVRNELIASHTMSVEKALRAAARQLPAMDPVVTANCWVGAVYQAVWQWLRQPTSERLDAEKLGDAIAEFNLRAIGAMTTGT